MAVCNFHRKFVKQYAAIAAPLTRLLKKGAKYDFNQDCVEAFNKLREAITSDQVLAIPDLNAQFRVHIDASYTAIGMQLAQIGQDNIERTICFAGRTLTQAEKNFTVTEIEGLSLISAIKLWHHFLCNQKFLVFSDHLSLVWINKIKGASGRLMRWSLMLQGYDYELRFKRGIKNIIPDMLSRRIYPENNEQTKFPATMNTDTFMPLFAANEVIHGTLSEDTEQVKQSYEILFEYENEVGQDLSDVKTDSENLIPIVFALDDIGKAQRESPELSDMFTYLETGDLPSCDKTARQIVIESDQYTLDDGVLYHIYQPRQKNVQRVRKLIRQTVIPAALRGEILHAMHDNLSHFGVDRTYASLILRYWWRGCYADTLDYVRKCLICQPAKRDVHSHHAKLRPIEVEGAFDTVHVDFLSLPETPEGYRYLILFVDSFSRWPEAFATKTQDMTVVADKLYSEIVCRYGAMRRLISDLGASLRSKLVEELCKRMNIKRTYTTAFRPQTNSHCERTNSVLINLLKTHISEQSDWPRFLPAVLG